MNPVNPEKGNELFGPNADEAPAAESKAKCQSEQPANLRKTWHQPVPLPPQSAYLTEQPYGREAGMLTGLPAIASVSACDT